MNFKEAVIEMEKGKKVKQTSWSNPHVPYLKMVDGVIYNCWLKTNDEDNELSASSVVIYLLGETYEWEVVDENKTWNLAEWLCDAKQVRPNYKTNWISTAESHGQLIEIHNIKKCRDLIIEDILEQNPNIYTTQINIINKRFGDLE